MSRRFIEIAEDMCERGGKGSRIFFGPLGPYVSGDVRVSGWRCAADGDSVLFVDGDVGSDVGTCCARLIGARLPSRQPISSSCDDGEG